MSSVSTCSRNILQLKTVLLLAIGTVNAMPSKVLTNELLKTKACKLIATLVRTRVFDRTVFGSTYFVRAELDLLFPGLKCIKLPRDADESAD